MLFDNVSLVIHTSPTIMFKRVCKNDLRHTYKQGWCYYSTMMSACLSYGKKNASTAVSPSTALPKNASTEGIVYLLKNRGMPGMVKIGLTTRTVDERMKELYTTGVPYPFECLGAQKVKDAAKVEKAIHRIFDDYRVQNREFFTISEEKALDLFSILEGEPLIKIKSSRQGMKWTFDEQATLLQMVAQEGVTCEQIANELGRSAFAIQARLKYIAVSTILEGRSYEEANRLTGIPIPEIEEEMRKHSKKKSTANKKTLVRPPLPSGIGTKRSRDMDAKN